MKFNFITLRKNKLIPKKKKYFNSTLKLVKKKKYTQNLYI